MIYGTAGKSFLSSRRNCFPSGQKSDDPYFLRKKELPVTRKSTYFFLAVKQTPQSTQGVFRLFVVLHSSQRFSVLFARFSFFSCLIPSYHPFFAWLVLFPLFAPPSPRVCSPPAPLNFHAPLRFAFAALNSLCFSAPDFLSSRFLVFLPLFSSLFLSRSFSSISRAFPYLHATLSRPHIIN